MHHQPTQNGYNHHHPITTHSRKIYKCKVVSIITHFLLITRLLLLVVVVMMVLLVLGINWGEGYYGDDNKRNDFLMGSKHFWFRWEGFYLPFLKSVVAVRDFFLICLFTSMDIFLIILISMLQ